MRTKKSPHQPKPTWIRSKLPTKAKFKEIKSILKNNQLHTVCEEALCPNWTECWESGTATFLLMGSVCTRNCKFCDVTTQDPHGILNPLEPKNLAQAVKDMKLKYVVLTSVTRDDLLDGGALHLAHCVEAVQNETSEVIIEILHPDFQGNLRALKSLVKSKPHVMGHNIETTRAMTPMVRDKRASFDQSLQILDTIKRLDSNILTKSSIMLGLGETSDQVFSALKELRLVDVDIVTIGQYLQPSRKNLDVIEYILPEVFEYWEKIAIELGFLYVASGPLVRSSYKAGEYYIKNCLRE
ncbi:MAG: lipoyl synthase [Candidatus Heimdallarchaeota archaeon]|nr:lipoyl synthase [Candidatus Heimdallarchaeota archaeon]